MARGEVRATGCPAPRGTVDGDRVGGYREKPGKAPAGSRTSEHDFHLIEGEDVRLVQRPVAELAVPIEYLVDEGTMPIRRDQPCPFDEGRLGEAGKRIP